MSHSSYKYIICQFKVWWDFSFSLLRGFFGNSNKSGLIWMYTLIFWIFLNNLLKKFTFHKWLVFCFNLNALFLFFYALIDFVDNLFPSFLALSGYKKWLLSACASKLFLFLFQMFVNTFYVLKSCYLWCSFTVLLMWFFKNNQIRGWGRLVTFGIN